jgi:hypothetical protein
MLVLSDMAQNSVRNQDRWIDWTCIRTVNIEQSDVLLLGRRM